MRLEWQRTEVATAATGAAATEPKNRLSARATAKGNVRARIFLGL